MHKVLPLSLLEQEKNKALFDDSLCENGGKLRNLKNKIKRTLTFSFSPLVSKLKLHKPVFPKENTKTDKDVMTPCMFKQAKNN